MWHVTKPEKIQVERPKQMVDTSTAKRIQNNKEQVTYLVNNGRITEKRKNDEQHVWTYGNRLVHWPAAVRAHLMVTRMYVMIW